MQWLNINISEPRAGKSLGARMDLVISDREARRNSLSEYWGKLTGRHHVERRTLLTVASYIEKVGPKLVFEWLDRASALPGPLTDSRIGKYISGAMRAHCLENAAKGGS